MCRKNISKIKKEKRVNLQREIHISELIYVLWGLRNMTKIRGDDIMTTGLVYPLSEHVDIFPARLVPTFH